ncbi:hypothetical protein ABEH28_13180 [Pseudomonas sp. Ps21-P2]|uniref:hypothetical protein n=1 Tax=Pseudomonas sp. Ps21-P2 TaxID=3080331 RepID=UPI00320A73B2
MSARLTKDERNELINEAMKSSIRFNAEQSCNTIDGGFALSHQGFYARYANDKDKIIKAAGIDPSRVTPKENIENILIAQDIIMTVRNEPKFFAFQRQVEQGHLSIDISTPVTSIKFSEEIASYVGSSKALEIGKTVNSNGTKDLNFYVPALQESGGRPDIDSALFATSEYVVDVLDDIKKKTELKQIEKPAVKSKLKM